MKLIHVVRKKLRRFGETYHLYLQSRVASQATNQQEVETF